MISVSASVVTCGPSSTRASRSALGTRASRSGAPGYAHLRRVLADPQHEDHDDLQKWVGELPTFDREATSLLLRQTVGSVPESVRLLLDLLLGGAGYQVVELSAEREAERITFADTRTQPRSVITSYEWSGSETGGRRYSPFVINTEHKKPWHTLTGRQHFFVQHDWMAELGEQLPVYRPPLNTPKHYGDERLQATHLTLVARAEDRRNQLLDHPAPSRYSPRAAMKSATASGTQ